MKPIRILFYIKTYRHYFRGIAFQKDANIIYWNMEIFYNPVDLTVHYVITVNYLGHLTTNLKSEVLVNTSCG